MSLVNLNGNSNFLSFDEVVKAIKNNIPLEYKFYDEPEESYELFNSNKKIDVAWFIRSCFRYMSQEKINKLLDNRIKELESDLAHVKMIRERGPMGFPVRLSDLL